MYGIRPEVFKFGVNTLEQYESHYIDLYIDIKNLKFILCLALRISLLELILDKNSNQRGLIVQPGRIQVALT